MECEMDGQFVAGIFRGILLDHCGLERAESERQSFFNSPVTCGPTLTHGHELWVVNERMRSQIQTASICFLQWLAFESRGYLL